MDGRTENRTPISHPATSRCNKNGILWLKSTTPEGEHFSLFVTPESMKNQVLESLHNAAGHQGIERTLSLVRKRCYWIGLDADVRNWIRHCERCTVSKQAMPNVKPKIKSLLAYKPLEIVAIDFTQLEKSSDGRENVLIMTDVFTKFTVGVPMNKNSAEGVIAPAGAKVTGATIRTWFLNNFISFLAVLTWKTENWVEKNVDKVPSGAHILQASPIPSNGYIFSTDFLYHIAQ